MPAELLDGKRLAETLHAETAVQVRVFTAERGFAPTLAVLLVGEDPASQVYVKNKRKACEKTGLRSIQETLPATATTAQVLARIAAFNADPAVHGILVQLPLPPQVDAQAVLDAVDPRKDVDAFHPENVGRLVQGRPRFSPCTPLGILRLLERNGVPTAGRHAVVLGRSEIVGKPIANMLLQKGVDATVTVCHSRTPDLADHCRRAEILIVAIGRPKFVTAEMVRPGATVIDVGINRTAAGLVGDVDFEPVRAVAGRITPVPGGVGPLTIAMLLENCLAAARLQTG